MAQTNEPRKKGSKQQRRQLSDQSGLSRPSGSSFCDAAVSDDGVNI